MTILRNENDAGGAAPAGMSQLEAHEGAKGRVARGAPAAEAMTEPMAGGRRRPGQRSASVAKMGPPPPDRAGGRAQARAQAKPSTSEHGAEQQAWGWWARAQLRVSAASTRPVGGNTRPRRSRPAAARLHSRRTGGAGRFRSREDAAIFRDCAARRR
jgi:hypothetical protein